MAGWDGGGVSLQDALAVNIINNTIISNDTTASVGRALQHAVRARWPARPGRTAPQASGTTVVPAARRAGERPEQRGAAREPARDDHLSGRSLHRNSGSNGSCRNVSYPLLYNNVFWQNRSFYIGVGALGTGTQNQQNVVTLYNAFTTTPAAEPDEQPAPARPGASYWDIGVRGDTGPTNHARRSHARPDVLGADRRHRLRRRGNNAAANPTVVSQYCNGSRIPPEFGGMGYQVPPGISRRNGCPTRSST